MRAITFAVASHALDAVFARDALLTVALVVAVVLAVALAASMHATRALRRRADAVVRFRSQAEELETQRAAAEHLALQLEQANAELERANGELQKTLEESKSAQDEAMRQADRLRLLDEASNILASSLDYETTVGAAARLAVPRFADWCSVDVVVAGQIRQLAVSHLETPELQRLSDVRSRTNVDPNGPSGLARVIRTGKLLFVPDMTDEFLASQARSPQHLAALIQLRIRSAMIVPMTARGHIIGALTMVSTQADRPFDDGSLALGRDLARRAAVAIDNAELYHAALVANESKTNFLATISHELRTPLTAIIGYDELLADGVSGTLNDAQRQQVTRIKVNARTLLALIEEILLYARLDAGRESVDLGVVSVRKVVDEAIMVVAPSAKKQQLALVAEPIDAALTLRTDGSRLRQILVNLIANAVKFTERGTVTIRAVARGSRVVFEVQDTGIGIAPEHLEHIFEPFWQVEQNKTRTAGGSGLGLSTTRRLVKLLGGECSVESQLRVGSTFRVVLPLEAPLQSVQSAA
jgi:signal transduction histidine kinase